MGKPLTNNKDVCKFCSASYGYRVTLHYDLLDSFDTLRIVILNRCLYFLDALARLEERVNELESAKEMKIKPMSPELKKAYEDFYTTLDKLPPRGPYGDPKNLERLLAFPQNEYDILLYHLRIHQGIIE